MTSAYVGKKKPDEKSLAEMSVEEIEAELKRQEEEFVKTKEKLLRRAAQKADEDRNARLKEVEKGLAKNPASLDAFNKYIGHVAIVNDRNSQIQKIREDAQTRINKLNEELKAAIDYTRTQYEIVYTTLVGEKVKEEYITEFLGKKPEAPAAKKAAGTGTGGVKKNIWHKAFLGDKEVSFVDIARELGKTEADLKGNSAVRVLESILNVDSDASNWSDVMASKLPKYRFEHGVRM